MVKTFRGRCQVIVRPEEDATGTEIVVSAKSRGLETGKASVKIAQ